MDLYDHCPINKISLNYVGLADAKEITARSLLISACDQRLKLVSYIPMSLQNKLFGIHVYTSYSSYN